MKKLLFFILLILSYTCVIANTLNLEKSYKSNTEISLINCTLPAPTGLVAATLGGALSGNVNLSWNAVSGAVDYEIKTIEVSSGNVINTSYTTNTTILLNPGPPQCYNFEVRAGCGNSEYSENFASAEACIDWVIDLVVDRYDCTINEEVVETVAVPSNGSPANITFNPTTVYDAKIYRIGRYGVIAERIIRFGEVQNNNHILFQQVSSKQQSYPTFGTLAYILPQTPSGSCTYTGTSFSKVHIANCGQTGASKYVGLQLSRPNSLVVTDEDPNYNYAITLMKVCSSNENRSSLSTDTNQDPQVSATPNPFTNEINLYLPDMESEHTNIQLFDLTGKLYYSKLSGLSTNQVTIPTSELPTGMYILRTQTADRVQTIKMIKTE